MVISYKKISLTSGDFVAFFFSQKSFVWIGLEFYFILFFAVAKWRKFAKKKKEKT